MASPSRQPQVSKGGAYGRWAPEVYCIGLRNVWKFTFDKKTGDLWAGDVGQNLWEIRPTSIKNGGNYGWSIKEGSHPFEPQRRQKPDPASKISPPIVEYPHAPTKPTRKDDGKSITGGYVYRGKALPAIRRRLCLRRLTTPAAIWGLREKDGKATVSKRDRRPQEESQAEYRRLRRGRRTGNFTSSRSTASCTASSWRNEEIKADQPAPASAGAGSPA